LLGAGQHSIERHNDLMACNVGLHGMDTVETLDRGRNDSGTVIAAHAGHDELDNLVAGRL
jgi:hypothetical protein